jgi:dUTP pyrophosphatase
VQVNFQRLDPEALPPRSSRDGDAGYDLATRIEFVLAPGERTALPTGVALEIPPGHAGLVLPRSGHARRFGLSLVNAPGLIDSGYRGEVEVLLINHGSEPVVFHKGDRIAQLVIVAVPTVEFCEVDELGQSERGTGGFGSTGR